MKVNIKMYLCLYQTYIEYPLILAHEKDQSSRELGSWCLCKGWRTNTLQAYGIFPALDQKLGAPLDYQEQ